MQPDVLEQQRDYLRACAGTFGRRGADAEDLVQDTMCRAIQYWGNFAPGTNLRAWLYTIMRNSVRTKARRKHLVVEDPEGLHEAFHMGPDNPEEALNAKQSIRVAFDICEEMAAPLMLSALGYSYEEMAEMLSLPEGTVKSRISRGRTKLAAALAEPRVKLRAS